MVELIWLVGPSVLPLRIIQYYQNFEASLPELRHSAVNCALNFQHVYSSYVALKASGLVELATREILSEYAQRHSNAYIRTFVENAVEWENSFNCEKIERLLNRFNPAWWPHIQAHTSAAQHSAVNSLKTLRDQFAHGRHNGTGYLIVEGYYFAAKSFIVVVANHIVP